MEQQQPAAYNFWARLALIPRFLLEVLKEFFTPPFRPRGFTLVKRNGNVFVVRPGADLKEADLSGVFLQRADLTEAKLQGASLVGADLEGANLEGADLEGADLSEANLRHANLRDVTLHDTSLRKADLLGANVNEALLQKLQRDKNIDLTGTLLSDSIPSG
jgi:uncharacterized protein YjbI with pentapeptide repeats